MSSISSINKLPLAAPSHQLAAMAYSDDSSEAKSMHFTEQPVPSLVEQQLKTSQDLQKAKNHPFSQLSQALKTVGDFFSKFASDRELQIIV